MIKIWLLLASLEGEIIPQTIGEFLGAEACLNAIAAINTLQTNEPKDWMLCVPKEIEETRLVNLNQRGF